MDDFEFQPPIGGTTSSLSVVLIDSSLTSRAELFERFANALTFPDYFGRNWDAFEECLQDLGWLKPSTLLIYHTEIPLLTSEEFRVYVNILQNAVSAWRGTGKQEHTIVVVFPPESKSRIQRLARETGDPQSEHS